MTICRFVTCWMDVPHGQSLPEGLSGARVDSTRESTPPTVSAEELTGSEGVGTEIIRP